MRRWSLALTGSLLLSVASPALAASNAAPNPDPWERFNRSSFALHQALDKAVLRPLALAYKRALPSLLQDGIHNVISNLTEPVVAANDLLQGRFHQAGLSTGRLVANSTLGIGGVFDVASKMGAPHHDNGFDITLGRYHVKAGPYLFIPLLGPASVRGIVGVGVDGLLDPLHWTNYPHQTTITTLRVVVGGIDTRARVDDDLQALMSEATDPYATLRSVYLQNEDSQIHAGEPAADQPLPDFGDPQTAPPAKPASPAAVAPPSPASTPATDQATPAAPAPTDPPPATAAPLSASRPG